MLPSDLKLDAQLAAFLDYTATKAGEIEIPLGSNRGPWLDEIAREFGSPLGSAWCALAVGHCRKKHGLWIPTRDVGSCDEWYLQAERAGLLVHTPTPGAAVLYTNHTRHESGRYAGRLDIVHMGTVLRAFPRELAWEGNTAAEKFEREGTLLTLKPVDPKRVAAYVLPRPLA